LQFDDDAVAIPPRPFGEAKMKWLLMCRFGRFGRLGRVGLLALSAGTMLPLAAVAAEGKAIYESTCVACHASGVANAPKLGDKAAWGARTGAGKPALLATVKSGKGAMPPMAGNPKLSDEEIRAAIDYMLDSLK
jgi:cytochrome c5